MRLGVWILTHSLVYQMHAPQLWGGQGTDGSIHGQVTEMRGWTGQGRHCSEESRSLMLRRKKIRTHENYKSWVLRKFIKTIYTKRWTTIWFRSESCETTQLFMTDTLMICDNTALIDQSLLILCTAKPLKSLVLCVYTQVLHCSMYSIYDNQLKTWPDMPVLGL